MREQGHPDGSIGGARRAPALFLLSSLVVGGSERKAVAVVNELHRSGQDVHLAYLNAPDTQRGQIRAGVPVVCLERRGKISVGAIRALANYVRRRGVSKIICVNLYPMIYAMAARAILPSQYRPAVVALANSTHHVRWKDRVAMLLYAPLLRRADRVVFGCRFQRDLWTKRYGLDRRRCMVIYNGVDVEHFSSAATPDPGPNGSSVTGRPGEQFLVGAVGQLRPVKNHVELIEALALLKDRLPRARAIIVGEGEERARIEALVRTRGLEGRVELPGQLDDVRQVLKKLDVFVLPSLSETFSNAALEAMAMSKAVVLSATGGASEMVDPGSSGYVYPCGSPAALAQVLERLASDARAREELGMRARAAVLERFSSAKMLDEYRRLVAG